jgi:hypothetical protein
VTYQTQGLMSKPEHTIQPNAHVAAMIVSSLTDSDLVTNTSEQVNPRTKLDSHANMFVAGKHAFVLARSGQTASVKAFSPDLAELELPIVDCALRYDCPYSNRSYILVVQHVLHVTSMDHNLLPPFLARAYANLNGTNGFIFVMAEPAFPFP